MTSREDRLELLFTEILHELGAGREPKSLDIENTPKRVAKMWAQELCKSYATDEKALVEELTLFPAEGAQEMVVQTDIPFVSVCAHHMLPFIGHAAIGYLPGDKLVGLSKLSRVLDYYAARFQIQERLGAQVADFLITNVEAEAAFVLLKAEHLCMACRGVKKSGVNTVTSSVRPLPPDRDLLTEFYALVGHGTRY